jgi:hypothetical protein
MPLLLAVALLPSAALAPHASAEEPAGVLSAWEGNWTGSNTLWFIPRNKALPSDATAVVEPATLSYTWAFKGKPQSGTLEVSGTAETLTAVWNDTWHTREAMTLQGSVADGRITLFCTYPPDAKKPWGWRIEIGAEESNLVMRMVNITPKGKEFPAVEMIVARAG